MENDPIWAGLILFWSVFYLFLVIWPADIAARILKASDEMFLSEIENSQAVVIADISEQKR